MPGQKKPEVVDPTELLGELGESKGYTANPLDKAPTPPEGHATPKQASEEKPDSSAQEEELLQRIAELEAKVALSEDELARTQGVKDVEPAYTPLAKPGAKENIVIHFVADGFTALGRVWVRGQELEFEPGSQPHKDTYDRNGRSWLALRDDEDAQELAYGEVKFRSGPWRGKPLTAAAGEYEKLKSQDGSGLVAGPSAEELAKAEAEERKRGRAAPSLPRM